MTFAVPIPAARFARFAGDCETSSPCAARGAAWWVPNLAGLVLRFRRPAVFFLSEVGASPKPYCAQGQSSDLQDANQGQCDQLCHWSIRGNGHKMNSFAAIAMYACDCRHINVHP